MHFKNVCNRIIELLSDKSSGIQPEFRQQLSNIAKRIEDLLRDNHGECDIPDDLIKEIARCLVPDIIAFFETEEAKREFEEWKLEQEKKLAEIIIPAPKDKKQSSNFFDTFLNNKTVQEPNRFIK